MTKNNLNVFDKFIASLRKLKGLFDNRITQIKLPEKQRECL